MSDPCNFPGCTCDDAVSGRCAQHAGVAHPQSILAIAREALWQQIRAEVLTEVFELLTNEAQKLRDHGDREDADLVEMLRAKVKALGEKKVS